ncbi:MAG: collagen-like protein [Bacteroidota bacterium]
MKTIKYLLMLPLLVALAACNNDDGLIGPEGPPGPTGPQGPQGVAGESGFLFEYTDIDFVAPDYEALLELPQDFEVFNEDKALVYLLWEVTENDVDVWRLLPQTIFLNDGMFQYNYDFTMYDVRLFMDGNFDLSTLQDGDLLNQIVRVVIVPAQFWSSGRMDFSNYNEVAETLGIPEMKVDRSNFKNRN